MVHVGPAAATTAEHLFDSKHLDHHNFHNENGGVFQGHFQRHFRNNDEFVYTKFSPVLDEQHDEDDRIPRKKMTRVFGEAKLTTSSDETQKKIHRKGGKVFKNQAIFHKSK